MPCLAGRGITQWVGELAAKAGGLEVGSPEPTWKAGYETCNSSSKISESFLCH